MTKYKIMPVHEESPRAPEGVCELSIQASLRSTRGIINPITNTLNEYVGPEIRVESLSYSDNESEERLVIHTGTDRLDFATLRDIAEVYGQTTKYGDGNIPPELSLVPTSSRGDPGSFFAWLEFKLEDEMPKGDVLERLRRRDSDFDVFAKNPIGEEMRTIVFRVKNVANYEVRQIINTGRMITDSLPVEYIRIICEPKGQ